MADKEKPELTAKERNLTVEDLAAQGRIVEEMTARIKKNADDARAYHERGGAFLILKQYEAAIVDYNKVIQLDPDEPAAYNNRANVYGHLEQYESAIADFNKAIEIDPNNANPYNNRGNA
jgi:tetratricopeptide (TPR) repeat protein